jgi:hypothetical protein
MDKYTIPFIAASLLMSFCKGFFERIGKDSGAAAWITTKSLFGGLVANYHLVFAAFDLLMAVMSFWLITGSLADNTPATKGFSALMGACALVFFTFSKHFADDLDAHIKMRRKRRLETIQARTAMLP